MKKFFLALLVIILIGGAGVGGYYLEKIINPQTENIAVATLHTELNSMADILKNLDRCGTDADTGDRANPYGKVPSGPDYTGGIISEWRLAYIFESIKQDAKEGVFYQPESSHYAVNYVLDIEGNVATIYSTALTITVEFNSDTTKTVKVYDGTERNKFSYFELVFDDAQLLKYEYYYVWTENGIGNIYNGFDNAEIGETIYYNCTLEREKWDFTVSQITIQGIVEKYKGVSIIDFSYRPVDETYTVAD